MLVELEMSIMNKNILKELEEIKKQVSDFENKYLFSNNNLVITAILNKLDVDDLVITYKEIEKFRFKNYVACYDEDSKTIIIRKYENHDM